MADASDPTYQARTYGSRQIGYGEKPGIVVVDFQTAFTDAAYPLGGAPLIERAVTNTARLLDAARSAGVPVATCYTAYHSKRDMPYWKVKAVMEFLVVEYSPRGKTVFECECRNRSPVVDYRRGRLYGRVLRRTPV